MCRCATNADAYNRASGRDYSACTDRLFRWYDYTLSQLAPVSGSQSEQEGFDLWDGIILVQFRIVGENRMEQSRTFLDMEAVIIHRFTCSRLTKGSAPVGFGLKRAFLRTAM